MGKFNRVRVGALCGALWACSGSASERPIEVRPVGTRERALAAQHAAPADPRFDAQGRLKSSGKRMSWLELPVGFREQPGSTAQEAAFDAVDMPFSKVREYLEARIVPDAIDYRANGTTFRRALPSHTRLSMGALQISLVEINRDKRELRLMIDDLTRPSTPTLPEAVLMRELAKARTQQE